MFLRPDGRKLPVHIDLDPELYFNGSLQERVDNIRDAGFQFHVEKLNTGMVSMTISDDDGDYGHQLVQDGPDVPGAVLDLITKFSISAATIQRNLNREE